MRYAIRHLVRPCLLMLALLVLSGCALIEKQSLPSGSGYDASRRGASGSALSVVETARSQLGVRYAWAGDSPSEGFDCSGLTYWVFRQHGVVIPRPSWEQYQVGREVGMRELRPGDLVFFRTMATGRSLHVGIVSAPGRFIHSPKAGGVVSESALDNVFWKRHFMGGRRLVG